MTIESREEKIFDLKPQLTLAMRLAASFAITYYGLTLIYSVLTLIFCRYSIDSYYLTGDRVSDSWSRDFMILIIQLVIAGVLVFSLIQIFRKKSHGKAIFVGVSILFIVFQLLTNGSLGWYKYALEFLLVIIIAPIRIKKKDKAISENHETTTESMTAPQESAPQSE